MSIAHFSTLPFSAQYLEQELSTKKKKKELWANNRVVIDIKGENTQSYMTKDSMQAE